MGNLRIVIKPMGLIALTGAIIVLMICVAVSRSGGTHQETGQPAVGAASQGGPSASPSSDAITDPGELEEKQMIKDWNLAPGQDRDWLFLGPIPAGSQIQTKANDKDAQAQMDRIIDTAYLPNEAKYEARENASFSVNGKTLTWRKVHGSAFDFKELFVTPDMPRSSMKNVVVYGVVSVDSPKAQKKVLHFRSDDGGIVWLNGTQVFKTTAIRGVRPEDLIPVNLRAGRNTFLVKVGQGDGGWGLVFHLQDPEKGKKAR